MRLPHHLKRLPSGLFYFRLTVPQELRPVYRVRELKHALYTRDPVQAKGLAYRLSAAYLEQFQGRGRPMAEPSADEVIALLKQGKERRFTITAGPHGYSVQTDASAQDNAAAIEAIGKLPPPPPAPAAVPGRPIVPLQLSDAVGKWLEKIKPDTLKDTLDAKRNAVIAFKNWIGNLPLSSIGAVELDEYRAHLQSKGNSLPTQRNALTYISQLFDWAILAGCYPKVENPATGQVKYGARQKRARKGFGWQPFTIAQLSALFNPVNYAGHKLPTEYWCPLIQLFTGTRITEVSQLAVADFVRDQGLDCIKITDEGEDAEELEKRTKTVGSIRTLPLHPQLIALGLLDYVNLRRASGDKQVFPYLVDGANGVGDRQGKAFGRYLKRLQLKPTGHGKLGSHSFRKTVADTMKIGKVRFDVACKYLGHEFVGVHQDYNSYTPTGFAEHVFPALVFPLNLDALKRPADAFERIIKRERGKNRAAARRASRPAGETPAPP